MKKVAIMLHVYDENGKQILLREFYLDLPEYFTEKIIESEIQMKFYICKTNNYAYQAIYTGNTNMEVLDKLIIHR